MCVGEIGTVTDVWTRNDVPMARVQHEQRTADVCALYVPHVVPGSLVVVQLGFIVELLDQDRAADALALRAGAQGVTP